MICPDMRIIRMCESARVNAYTHQGITDFSVNRVRVHGVVLVIRIGDRGKRGVLFNLFQLLYIAVTLMKHLDIAHEKSG